MIITIPFSTVEVSFAVASTTGRHRGPGLPSSPPRRHDGGLNDRVMTILRDPAANQMDTRQLVIGLRDMLIHEISSNEHRSVAVPRYERHSDQQRVSDTFRYDIDELGAWVMDVMDALRRSCRQFVQTLMQNVEEGDTFRYSAPEIELFREAYQVHIRISVVCYIS